VSHEYVEMSRDSIKDNIDNMIISHICINIEPINIVKVLLQYSIYLEYYDLIICLVSLIMLAIVHSECFFNSFPYVVPLPISFPPF